MTFPQPKSSVTIKMWKKLLATPNRTRTESHRLKETKYRFVQIIFFAISAFADLNCLFFFGCLRLGFNSAGRHEEYRVRDRAGKNKLLPLQIFATIRFQRAAPLPITMISEPLPCWIPIRAMIPVISFQWSLMFVKTLRLETRFCSCPPEELKYYLKTDSWYPLIPFADKYNQHEKHYFLQCWCLAFLSINSANWKLQIYLFIS